MRLKRSFGFRERSSRPSLLESGAAPDSEARYPLSGELMDGRQSRDWLTHAIAKAHAPIRICSGYLRSEALLALLVNASNGLQGRILVRWQFGDLLSGASDLAAYPIARDRGLQFAVRQDFHGKVFAIPDQGIVVGSANATLAGLALKHHANLEVCTRVEASDTNIQLVDALFDSSVLMSDELFKEIEVAVGDAALAKDVAATWPKALAYKLETAEAVDRLLISECLWAPPEWLADSPASAEGRHHDQQLLGLPPGPMSKELANRQFSRARIYRWLIKTVRDAGGSIYFGELSMALQKGLLDNPDLSRRDVKTLLQNLLIWCGEVSVCEIYIDRPQYSQRISLKM
jgi:hypothetical protein